MWGHGHWEWKCKNLLSYLRQRVNRFTSNQDQNDQRHILHISSNTFHQLNYFVFWWYLSVIIGTSQQPLGCATTCWSWIRDGGDILFLSVHAFPFTLFTPPSYQKEALVIACWGIQTDMTFEVTSASIHVELCSCNAYC